MSSISFDNVYLLWIAVPLVVLFAVPVAIAIVKDNRRGHNIVSMVLHVFMAALIAFAAAGTKLTTVITETDVFVVADVSYSAKNNLDVVDEYIKNLGLPNNSKLGLVCFGKDYQLLSKLGDPENVQSVKNATVDDTESNIAAALTYTGTLFGTGVIKRIVLITDGKQTDLSSDNSIRRAVDGLVNQKIKVDAIFLDDNPNLENYTEVQISGVDFTESVYMDSEQVAKVAVQSSYQTDAYVTLRRDGEEIQSNKKVNLTPGNNLIELELDTSEAGIFDYEVTITADNDASDRNNVYFFTQTVSDEMKVLVVTQSWADCVATVQRYGDKGIIDVYESDEETSSDVKDEFVRSYADSENVNIYTNNKNVPFVLEELCEYDEIILANIDVGTIPNFTQFIYNLDTAVSDFGKSLITMGNMYIQNREDDELVLLEDMLPVRYGNKDEDPKLYTIIIDGSRSMGHLYHMDVAKELSIGLINLLNDEDYVSIFKFDGEVESIYNGKSLKDRNEVIEVIKNFEVANGTVIGSGMQRAYEQIKNLQYSEKQVMLISDGITFGEDEYDPVQVAAQMYADEIVTSVFDVGRQGDGANGSNVVAELSAAKKRLENIAAEGHGKYYYSNNVEYLDDVTFGELADDMTVSVVTADTSVNVEIPRDDVLGGLDLLNTKIPDVSGYVYSGIKPSATTVLTVNHMRASGRTVEKPLFAHWKYGYGKVATFTSSIGEWTKRWDGDLKDSFCENLFETNVPTNKNANPYKVNVLREGSHTRVEAELSLPRLDASALVRLTLPNGEIIIEEMRFSGNSYYYEFDASEFGKYAIDITYLYNEREYSQYRAIHVCYIDEYDAFAQFDATELHRALDGRGTVSTDGNLKLTNSDKEVGKYVVSFAVPLLIAAAALFVIDIAIRKLKWEDIKSFFGSAKKQGGKKK